MARKPRLHFPGAVYHVILRGNARADIFFEEEDREVFCRLLAEGVARFDCRVHAFCLMSNHVHLAVQVGEIPLSRLMQNLAFRYTRHVNTRLGRAGHLFEGRFKAYLVDRDHYLLELVRYVHLNPVRARLVKDPQDYAYSGHSGYLGRRAFPFLTTDWVLSRFGDRVGIARRRYAAFVAQGTGEGHREDFYGGEADGRVVGDERFTERALARSGVPLPGKRVPVPSILKSVCAARGLKPADLRAPGKGHAAAEARALVCWFAVELAGMSLARLAGMLGRDASTLSRAVTVAQRRAAADPAFRRDVRRMRKALSPL